MKQRVQALQAILETEGLDALVVTQAENRRYLTGFTGSAGAVLVTGEETLLATDFRYYEQVQEQAPQVTLVRVEDSTSSALAPCIGDLGVHRLGFESHVMTVQEYEQWRDVLPQIEWVATTDLVERLRMTKDAREIDLIEEAVRIADEAMAYILEWIRPGVTEREVAWELEVQMRTHGAEALSFTTIVGSGPNSAMPHATTSERAIGLGEPIVIDMGARYEGYCSDMTRSFCLGQASEEYLKVWDTVLRAQQAAEEAIKPGMSGVEADALARDVIDEAGYEGKFGHGLGHGVGLAIHEAPRVSHTSEDMLGTGAVVTVEPGIYIPGWGGVRIEDTVVLTDEGCRVLTQTSKQPVICRN
ncbi:MAG: aminopeptidase P family protein [Chloroflexota bacterium]|nr:aminopeptidase P family protein [Chloroflexota bacterium]